MKNLVLLFSCLIVSGCSGSSSSPPAEQRTSDSPAAPTPALKTTWKWANSDLLEYRFPGRSSFGDSVYDPKSGATYIVAGIGAIDRGGGIYLYSTIDDGKTWNEKGVIATPSIRWGFSNFDGIALAIDTAGVLYLEYSAPDASTGKWSAVILKTSDQGGTWQRVGAFSLADSYGYLIQKMTVLPSGSIILKGTYDQRDGVILKFANQKLSELDRYPSAASPELQNATDGRIFVLAQVNRAQVIRESSDEGLHWISHPISFKENLSVLMLSTTGEFFVAGQEPVKTGTCADFSIYKTKDLTTAWKMIGSLTTGTSCEEMRAVSGSVSSAGHIHVYGSIGGSGSYTNKTFLLSSSDDGGSGQTELRTYTGYIGVFPKKLVTTKSQSVIAAANTSPGGSSANDFFGLLSIGTAVVH